MTYVKNHVQRSRQDHTRLRVHPPPSYALRQSVIRKNHGGRNLFDTAELARVYGDLKINGNPSLSSKPVNDGQMTDNDTPTKIVALLESQNTELKAQLEKAHTENAQLLELATRLQKQNELLMIPPPQPKRRFFTFLRRK